MNCDRVLSLLTEHKPVLVERFGVQRLALFGSFARDTEREDSVGEAATHVPEALRRTAPDVAWRQIG